MVASLVVRAVHSANDKHGLRVRNQQMYLIPGLFPEPAPLPTTEQIDRLLQSQFVGRQIVTRKTRIQHEIFHHIDAVVYVIAAYQYIKFCHLACLLPAVLHCGVQKLLVRDLLDSGVLAQLDPQIRHQIDDLVSRNLYLGVWWKAVICIVYHVGFVFWWLLPLANLGDYAQIGNGTWWFVLFIGEELPVIDPHATTATKLWQLGLVPLVLTDVVVLFCQVVLHQAVFRQSTVFQRRFSDKEVYLVRPMADMLGVADESIDPDALVPEVLRVKVFEEFDVWHRLQPVGAQ